jgi:tRNA 2-selenouridine synthase
MKAAPLLEVRRPLEARLRHLVAIYGDQDRGALVEATERIRKRLGPQRTTAAVEAIHLGQMEEACRHMLDYYDRCYDNDTAAHRATAADLGGLSADEGAELLLKEGFIKPASLRREPEQDR